MPIKHSAALPLNIIRQRARIRVASYGGTATNLYVRDAIYRGGEVLQPKRGDIVVPRDSIIVFADDEPTKNWGHRCRYLFHDPKTGELIQELPALLPPTFDFAARFELFHQASTVSAASRSQYPLLYLPPWLYLESASSWYAILYSGASMNRHVNDIEFLYRILVNLYRVPAANITVLSFDGTLDYNDAFWQKVPPPVGNWPGDNTPYQMKINGSGTKEELLAAIAAVGEKMGPNDNLFLHTNNHGNTVNGVSTLISYSGDDTTQSDLSDAIKALPKFASFMVMMEQCFSGGFIQPIINASPASCTSVATAVDANTSSNGGPQYDPFALAWITAMAWANPDGSSISPTADTNVDDRVSASEAFVYAKANDTGPDDNPQYAENAPCGGAANFGGIRRPIFIPPLYRYLFPWQILPDPPPEQVEKLAIELRKQLKSKSFRQGIAESIEDERNSLTKVVRMALSKGKARRPSHR